MDDFNYRAAAEALVRAPNVKTLNAMLAQYGIERRIHQSVISLEWYLGDVIPGNVYEYGTFSEVRAYAAGHVAYDLGGLDAE